MSERPVLHVMPQTRSGTVIAMDEELGGVCERRLVNLKTGDGRKPEFLAINPMGKVPALTRRGVAVTEAAAICAYLADAYPRSNLAPATDDPLRGVYYRWMFFAPSVIEPMMLDKLGGVDRSNSTAAGHGDFTRVMAAIDSALAKGPFLLGDSFSAADVVMGSTLNFATMFGAIPKDGAVKSYVERVTARPSFARAAAWSAEATKALGL